MKICSLLAVGFGDAGAEVISDNIKSGGDLNPMIPGHKVIAIFGFCDIRQFTDATEVLQVRSASSQNQAMIVLASFNGLMTASR